MAQSSAKGLNEPAQLIGSVRQFVRLTQIISQKTQPLSSERCTEGGRKSLECLTNSSLAQYSGLVVEANDNISTAAFAKPNVHEEDRDRIVDCDISIADTKTAAKDLVYTIAHELGHCIGLGHPHTNYGAIMGYSRMARDLRLGADDIAGLIYLYPDPNYVSGEPKEIVCASVTSDAGKGLFGSVASFGLLTLPLLLILLGAAASQVKQRVPVKVRARSKNSPVTAKR